MPSLLYHIQFMLIKCMNATMTGESRFALDKGLIIIFIWNIYTSFLVLQIINVTLMFNYRLFKTYYSIQFNDIIPQHIVRGVHIDH